MPTNSDTSADQARFSDDQPTCIIIGGAPGSYGGQVLAKIYPRINDRPITVIDDREKSGSDSFDKIDQAVEKGNNIVFLTEDPSAPPYEVFKKHNYSIDMCAMATHPTLSFAVHLLNHDQLINRDPGATAPLMSYSQHQMINADWISSANDIEKGFRVDKLRVMHREGTEIYSNQLIDSQNPRRGWLKTPGAVGAMMQGYMTSPNEVEEALLERCARTNSEVLANRSLTNDLTYRHMGHGDALSNAYDKAKIEIEDRKTLKTDLDRKNLYRSFDYFSNSPAHDDSIMSHCQQWVEDLKIYASDVKQMTLPAKVEQTYNISIDPDKHFAYLDRAVIKISENAAFRAGDRRIAYHTMQTQLRQIFQQAAARRNERPSRTTPAEARGLHERPSRSR